MKSKVLMLALATTVFALSSKAQVSYGIRAGINFQNINGEDLNGRELDHNLKTGFHIGVNAELPVAPDFYLQPGLLFSTKGFKDEYSGRDFKYNLSYLEVPVNFLYKPSLGIGKLLLGFGPYVAFGVGGKAKYNGNDEDIEFEKEVTETQYGADYYIKRMDFGANFLFGFELSSKISAQLNAQLGLKDVSTDIEGLSNDQRKTKNTGFGISVGYRF